MVLTGKKKTFMVHLFFLTPRAFSSFSRIIFFSYFRLNSFSTRWRNRWVYKVENMVVRFGQDMLRISLFHLVYYCWINHETMQRYYFLIFVFLNFRIFFHVCRTWFDRICPQTKHFILFYYFLGRISEFMVKTEVTLLLRSLFLNYEFRLWFRCNLIQDLNPHFQVANSVLQARIPYLGCSPVHKILKKRVLLFLDLSVSEQTSNLFYSRTLK